MMTTRRGFVAASVSASLVGCVSISGDSPSTQPAEGATRTSSPVPGKSSSPTRTTSGSGVFLGVTNYTDAEQSVTVTMRRNGERVFDQTVTLAPGSREGFPAAITRPGEYRITVAVDSGMTRTLTQRFPGENDLPIERYILEIEVRSDDVTFSVLHEDPTPTPPPETKGRL